jgi:hypothetical protein
MRLRIWSVPILAAATLVGVGQVSAQGTPRAWITAGAGLGGSKGGGDVYRSGSVYTAYFDAGVRIIGRAGIEGTFELARDFGRGDYVAMCPCPANYDLSGWAGAVVIHAGPTTNPSVVRAAIGAGSYRVRNDFPFTPPIPEVREFGLRFSIDLQVLQGSHNDLSVGLRPIVLPDANGETLWVVPLTVSGRYRL